MSTEASTAEQSTSEPQSDQSRAGSRSNRSSGACLGVLVEKAKTTPENYPLSLNCAQERLQSEEQPRAADAASKKTRSMRRSRTLRPLGAVSEIQGSGRVNKFRHLAYEWLGVEKVEMAVMAELLLRGAQTVGELRGRAARMEPIKDLADLRPVLDSLVAKGLVHVPHAGRPRRDRDPHALSGSRNGQGPPRSGAMLPRRVAEPRSTTAAPAVAALRPQPAAPAAARAHDRRSRARSASARTSPRCSANLRPCEPSSSRPPRSCAANSTSSIDSWGIDRPKRGNVLPCRAPTADNTAELRPAGSRLAQFLQRQLFLAAGGLLRARRRSGRCRAGRCAIGGGRPPSLPAADFTLPLVLLALLLFCAAVQTDVAQIRAIGSRPWALLWGTLAVWIAPALLVLVAAVAGAARGRRRVDGGIAGRAGARGVDAGRQFVGRLDAARRAEIWR